MSGSAMSQTVFCFHLYIFGKSIRILWDVNTQSGRVAWRNSIYRPPPICLQCVFLLLEVRGWSILGRADVSVLLFSL